MKKIIVYILIPLITGCASFSVLDYVGGPDEPSWYKNFTSVTGYFGKAMAKKKNRSEAYHLARQRAFVDLKKQIVSNFDKDLRLFIDDINVRGKDKEELVKEITIRIQNAPVEKYSVSNDRARFLIDRREFYIGISISKEDARELVKNIVLEEIEDYRISNYNNKSLEPANVIKKINLKLKKL